MNSTTFEQHYRISELMIMWGMKRTAVRNIVKDEKGVLRLRLGKKQMKTLYTVPASVAERIHRRLTEV